MNRAERTTVAQLIADCRAGHTDSPAADRLERLIVAQERPKAARNAPKPKRPRQDPPELRDAKQAVRRRSGGRCEAGTEVCTEQVEHVHHRKMRSAGGSHSVDNLLALCHACHDWIHANPEESYARGWLLHSWQIEGPLSSSYVPRTDQTGGTP